MRSKRTDRTASRGAWLVVAILTAAMTLVPGAVQAEESVSSLKRMLAGAIQGRQVSAAQRACKGLFGIGSAEAMKALADVGCRADTIEVERYIGARIVKMPTGEGLLAVCQLANKHKNERVRILFTLALAQRGEKEAVKAVMQSLFDNQREVVRATLGAVQEADSLVAVDFLIKALGMWETRGPNAQDICFDIRGVLYELTGHDFQVSGDWKNFWEPRKVDFKRPPKKKKKDGFIEGEKPSTQVIIEVPRFFDIEVPDKNVLFILDVSGSMSIKDPLPEESADDEFGKDGKGTGSTGVAKKKKKKASKEIPQEDIPSSRMRLKRVQKELIRVLEELDPDVNFNIISFNNKIEPFKSALIPASRKNKAMAIRYVQGFNPEGETYTDRALEKAFDMPGGITAMYLLSDGAPRRDGSLLDIDPIVKFVKEENRFRRIRVHTIGFRQAGGNLKRFLKRVAFVGMGKYVELN